MDDEAMMLHAVPDEFQESSALQRVEPTALESVTRGEVDMQVTTAKRFPRSVQAFKRDALSLATVNKEVATACVYALPRGGKTIEGPSVRLAEIVAGAWGNLRVEARILSADEKEITAQATCWDMQRNVAVKIEKKRPITGKNGRRFNDDMITMAGNAAASIALRNAIFRIVPMAYINEIVTHCKRIRAGGGNGLEETRAKWMLYFERRGYSAAQVCALLDKTGVEDIDLEDVGTLQGIHTAVDQGETTLEEIFSEIAPELSAGKHAFGFGKRRAGVRSAGAPSNEKEPESDPDPSDP